MTLLKRVGIHPYWPQRSQFLSKKNRMSNSLDEMNKIINQCIHDDLDFYVINGYTKDDLIQKKDDNVIIIGGVLIREDLNIPSTKNEHHQEVSPYRDIFLANYKLHPWIGWSGKLKHIILDYAHREFATLEKQQLSGHGYCATKALFVFATYYTSSMIKLCYFERTLNNRDIIYTAFGILTCSSNEPLILAKLLVKNYSKKFELELFGHFPISHFILRLFADALGERPIVLTGEIMWEPIFTTLYEHWRTPNLDLLTELCLAACDAHTHRATESDYDDEVRNNYFEQMPLELLLMFYFRSELGLENPIVEHPLMQNTLSTISEKLPFSHINNYPDNILIRIRERMKKDYYDEENIIAYYYTPLPN